MEKYDVLIVGSGSGLNIASRAVRQGLDVAVVEKDSLGGACLNRGCIPSKTMVYPADVVQEAKEAEKVGVEFPNPEINFQKIMERTRKISLSERERMRLNVEQTRNLDLYNDVGKFTGEYTMEVSGEEIKADKIFLFSGSRPLIPSVGGIENTGYYTNRSIFDINQRPNSLIIIGGGYVAAEFAHAFSAFGTDVTVLETTGRLLPTQDPEISKVVEDNLSSRLDVRTNHEVVEIGEGNSEKYAIAEDTQSGKEVRVAGEAVLIAAGRKSNADLLQVENTGVETDESGWITTDKYLETTKSNIWAGGDATGKHLFKHVANYEATVAWNNAFSSEKTPVDYHAVPSAIFTRPQVASVGLDQEEAKEKHEVLVGKCEYKDTAKGYAIGGKEGFFKILVEEESEKILGAHVVGPHAPVLVQEVTNLMYAGEGTVSPLRDALHIHPALSEVVSRSLDNLQKA